MGHVDELIGRLKELQEVEHLGWYPEDLLDQLQDRKVKAWLDAIEEAVHKPLEAGDPGGEPVGLPPGIITYPVEGLNQIFFYRRNELVVQDEAREVIVRELDAQGRRSDASGERQVGRTWILPVDTEGTTVPALARQLDLAVRGSDESGRHLVSPHHILMGGPLHSGGPGNNPDNKTGHHHPRKDLTPLTEPTGNAGQGVVIAVIDSGILPASELPAWMKANVVMDSIGDVEDDYFDVVGTETFIRYPRVHGTFVTGIIKQQAPGATILVKRLLDKDGTASEEAFAHALNAVLDSSNGPPQIINLSLGCPAWTNNPPQILAEAFERVLAQTPPIVVVAAAGNAGAYTYHWPACDPSNQVIGVGAVDAHGRRAEFSNFGPPVKLWARGDDVVSVYAHGVFARESMKIYHRPFAGLASWGGTSFAAPLVTGLIAKAITPSKTAYQVASGLLAASTVTGTALPPGHAGTAVPLIPFGVS